MSGFVDTLPAGNTQAKTPTVSHKLNLDELLEPALYEFDSAPDGFVLHIFQYIIISLQVFLRKVLN